MVKTEQTITQTSSSSSSSKAMTSSPSSSAAAAASRKIKKYKGVRMRSWGSWVSEIRAPNQKTRIWLGSYSTAEAAARAYDAALLCLKGSSANLNFPVSASSHFNPHGEITNMSPKSIQRMAAAAANSFLDDNNDVITPLTNNNVSSPPSPPQPPSPPLHSPSSSSLASSPSMSSSPLNVVDDDMSPLMGSFDTSFGPYTPTCYDHDHQLPIMSSMEPWSNNFDDGLQYSSKYLDQMLDGALFDPPTTYDFYEDCDIPLWSFC